MTQWHTQLVAAGGLMPELAHAEAYVSLLWDIDRENVDGWMTVLPNERGVKAGDVFSIWRRFRANQVLFLQWYDGVPVAVCALHGGGHSTNRHVASMVLFARASRSGAAGVLVRRTLREGFARGIRRAEGKVVVANCRALTFYDKLGFQREGTREMGFYKNGVYYDEVWNAIIARTDKGFRLGTRDQSLREEYQEVRDLVLS